MRGPGDRGAAGFSGGSADTSGGVAGAVVGGVVGGVAGAVSGGVAGGVAGAVSGGVAGARGSSSAGAPAGHDDPPIRVLLAKVGLDGHDRGLRVVARVLRDHGFEVIFAGLRQTPEAIAAAVVQEDVDVVGVSMHNGAHLTLAPAVIGALHDVGLATPVIVGGIVPDVDVPRLEKMGVAAVLGPGASNDEVVDAVRAAALAPPNGTPGARGDQETAGRS